MRAQDELLIGEWAILALLCEGPSHRYAIAGVMAPDGSIGRIWTLSEALTYRAVKVLRERGLVRAVATVQGSGGPRRTELEASEAGAELCERWLATPERHLRDLRSGLLLKLTFLQRRGSPLDDLLAAQRAILEAREAELRPLAVDGDLPALWRHTLAVAAQRFVDQVMSDNARSDTTGTVRR